MFSIPFWASKDFPIPQISEFSEENPVLESQCNHKVNGGKSLPSSIDSHFTYSINHETFAHSFLGR